MDKITQSKILVGSVSKSVKLAKVYGKLDLKSLYLLNIVGGFIEKYPDLDYDVKQKLTSLYNTIKYNNSEICNFNTKDIKAYKSLTFCESCNDVFYTTDEEEFTNLSIVQNTQPPSVDNASVTIIEDYLFKVGDFSLNFTDPRGGTLGTVLIEALPSTGKLQLNGIDITAPLEIDVNDVSNLKYVMLNETFPIVDTFNFKVSNNDINKIFSNMATITLNIQAAVNQPPSSVGDNSVTIANGSTHIFTVAQFTTETTPAYADPEGDNASQLKITGLPVDGELQFNGVPVTLNQIIPLTGAISVSSGAFRYVSEQNSPTADTETFTFQISDEGSGLFSG